MDSESIAHEANFRTNAQWAVDSKAMRVRGIMIVSIIKSKQLVKKKVRQNIFC